MRALTLAIFLAMAVLPVAVLAQAVPARATVVYSTAKTSIGKLMADPEAKAVLVKHIPQLGQNRDDAPGSGIQEQASEMTLKELADATRAYTGEMFSDKVLAAIDADLAKIHPSH